jgi:hypothetical protein
LTQAQLAKAITYVESMVAMVETARRKPKRDFIERCDAVLETGGALLRLYEELLSREATPDWLDRWRTVLEQATEINSFQPLVVHGLLQTPDYARAILEAGPPSGADIDAKLAAWLVRQTILNREDPPDVRVRLGRDSAAQARGRPEGDLRPAHVPG